MWALTEKDSESGIRVRNPEPVPSERVPLIQPTPFLLSHGAAYDNKEESAKGEGDEAFVSVSHL